MTAKSTSLFKYEKTIIVIIAIMTWIALWPATIATLAYGLGNAVWLYLILYPSLLVAIILMIRNVQLGYYALPIISLLYAGLFLKEVEQYLIFDIRSDTLFYVIFLPFAGNLLLLAWVSVYLSRKRPHARYIKSGAIGLASFILILPIISGYDSTYTRHIFIDATVFKDGKIQLDCRPGFGDSRSFVLTSFSPQLAETILSSGEYHQGSYFIHNVTIQCNYRFDKLKSVTLRQMGPENLSKKYTWTRENIQGAIDFLIP